MSYNYKEMKKQIKLEEYEAVKNTALSSNKEILTFNDFGAGLSTYTSWDLLAIIDKLVEDGILQVVKNEGFRQYWEYRVCYSVRR